MPGLQLLPSVAMGNRLNQPALRSYSQAFQLIGIVHIDMKMTHPLPHFAADFQSHCWLERHFFVQTQQVKSGGFSRSNVVKHTGPEPLKVRTFKMCKL